MKKMLWVMVIGILLAGNVWAYTTCQEAVNAGYLKMENKDYVGAKADFAEAIALSDDVTEKGNVIISFSDVFVAERDYAQAKSKLQEAINTSAYPHVTTRALTRLATISFLEGNHTQQLVEMKKVLLVIGGYYGHKLSAFEVVKSSIIGDINYLNQVIALSVETWDDYLMRAKAKSLVPDFVSAKEDLQIAIALSDKKDTGVGLILQQELQALRLALGEK